MKKPKIRTFYILKMLYIQGVPRKRQYHCSFRGGPKIYSLNDFGRSILGDTFQEKKKEKAKRKKKKQNKDTIHFQTAKYRMLHKRSNTTAPFAELLKLQE